MGLFGRNSSPSLKWARPGTFITLNYDGDGDVVTKTYDVRVKDSFELFSTDEEQLKLSIFHTKEQSKKFLLTRTQEFNQKLYHQIIGRHSLENIIPTNYIIRFVDKEKTIDPIVIRVHNLIVLQYEFFNSAFNMGTNDDINIVVNNLSKNIVDVIIKFLYVGDIEYSEIKDIFEDILVIADFMLLDDFINIAFKLYFLHTKELPFIDRISIKNYQLLYRPDESDFKFNHDIQNFEFLIDAILYKHCPNW